MTSVLSFFLKSHRHRVFRTGGHTRNSHLGLYLLADSCFSPTPPQAWAESPPPFYVPASWHPAADLSASCGVFASLLGSSQPGRAGSPRTKLQTQGL